MTRNILCLALFTVLGGTANAADWQANAAGSAPSPYVAGNNVPLGATSISQQTDNAGGTAGVSCGEMGVNTGENSFYRRFYFSEYGAAASASVSAVTIAIRDGGAGANPALPITVNLYTIPAATPIDTIPLAALTQIGTATTNVSLPTGNAPTTFTIPVTGTVTDTTASNLVVEWTNGVGAVTVPSFFPANNASAETHPSFIRAPGCSLNAPATFASIGFLSSLIIVVEGSGLPVSLQQFKID